MKSSNFFGEFLTIPELLKVRAAESADFPAVLGLGRPPLTYGALLDLVCETAGRLRSLGMGRGDRVAFVLPNGPEMATAFLAVSSCAASAPLNPAYRAEEFDFYLSDLHAKALVVEAGSSSLAVEAARARGIQVIELRTLAEAPAGAFFLTAGSCAAPEFSQPSDVALVLHTSGTTSRPKMVPLTHMNLSISAGNVARSLALTRSDRCLNIMPLFHIHGLVAALLSSLWAGGSVACTPGLDTPSFLGWLQEFEASWYTAVPTMHQSILARAERDHQAPRPLRLIRSCSAALPPQLMAEMERVFQAPVIEAYGMTEAAHQMACNPLPPHPRKPGSVGLAAGPEIAIMDEEGLVLPAGSSGEVVIRGPNVTPGYENNPEANAAAHVDGWFRTGDQGALDSDGYLWLTGRLKEIINRGGEKISPREIDEVLLNHPAVGQALTFAVPDQRLGEDVGAAIVLRPDFTATPSEIQEFAAAHMADFKVPRTVVFLNEIPKGPTGKPQRIGLAERLGLPSKGDGTKVGTKQESLAIPRNRLEARLKSIWADVMGLKDIRLDESFFELGGHSLLAVRLLSRVEKEIGLRLPTGVLLAAPTIEGLARHIEQSGHDPSWTSLVPIQADGSGAPLFCLHGNGGDVLFYSALARRLGPEQPVYGLQSPLLKDFGQAEPTMEELARAYLEEILALQPQGPYCLAGFCMGAYLAFEVARQLQQRGRHAGLVAVIGTPGNWKLAGSWVDKLRFHIRYLRGPSALSYLGGRFRYRAARIEDWAALLVARAYGALGRHVPGWAIRCAARAAHIRASRAYFPGEFRGKLLYFGGDRDLFHDFQSFWGGAVVGEMESCLVPGRGIGVLREPNVRVLAEKLKAALEGVSARVASGGQI